MKEAADDTVVTKVEDLRRKIHQMALDKGPDAQLPPVREMCEIFSTSRITLREALAPLLAERTLYSKEREGIFVSPYIHYKSVAILFDASIFALRGISPFWTQLWVFFFQEAERRTRFKEQLYTFYNIMPNLDIHHSLPKQVIQMITAKRIHGILAVGLSTPVRDWLIEQSISYVSFAGGGPWVIHLHALEMVRVAAKTLIEQGCTKIGLWQATTQRSANENIQSDFTFSGLQQAFREAQLPFSAKFSKILPLPIAQPEYVLPFQEQGYLLAKDMFAASDTEKPDGLILGDEMLAHGVLIALQEMGIQVGEDVKVAAHANAHSPMLFGQRKIIIFEFDPVELVQTMFATLDTLLQGLTPSSPVIYILPRRRQ